MRFKKSIAQLDAFAAMACNSEFPTMDMPWNAENWFTHLVEIDIGEIWSKIIF